MQTNISSTRVGRLTSLLIVLFVFTLSAVAGGSGPGSSSPSSSGSFALTLGGETFDPVAQGSSGMFADYEANPSGDFHLIQFEGPIQTEWFQGIRSHGIQMVQYVHPYTYIVWAAESEMASARNMSGVRWTGPFLPEFRVIPEQRGLGNGREPTNLLVSRHADQRALFADLDSLDVEVLHSQPYLGHFMLLETSARGDIYMDLGRLAPVYTVQQAVPMAPRTEMSNQSIVGNYGPAPDHELFPGYANWLTDTGYDGSGVTVSIIDGGVRESHQDLVDNIVPCVSQGSPTSCTSANNNHGTHVAGAIGGSGASGTTDSAGFLRGQGVAPGASLVQQRYGSSGLTYNFGSSCSDPDNYCTTPSGMLVLFKEAALSGATHANNSWGSTGIKIGYDLPTQQVDVMTRDATPDNPVPEPVLPVWSIMNGNGDSAGACNNNSLGSPDEAKNLFAVGSTWMQPGVGQQYPNIFDVSANSAHGPACDGRVGVHIVAPGCSTDAPSGGSDSAYQMMCGTSMASPVASGAIAVFIEQFRDLFGGDTPSPAMMKAAFMAVATNLHGFENADGGTITDTPSRFQGYGRIDLDAVVNPEYNVMYFDQETVLTATGQDWSLPLMAADPSEPVRIMMVFTDAYGHGLGGTTPAWVNDLDLSVSVGGDTYLGNQIGSDGFSVTGGTPDDRNNMEAVFLRADQHGGDVFNVDVFAANIAADAINPHDPGAPAQDFALVCYNCEFGDPTFSLGLDPDTIGACIPDTGSENHDVLVNVGALGAYTGTVALSASGEPTGVSTSFDPTSVAAPGTSDLTVTVDSTTSAGASIITVTGNDGDDTIERELALLLDDPLTSGPSLNAPGDGATDLTLTPTFDWDALPDVTDYRIQVATDAGFSNLVHDEVVEDTSFVVEDELDTGTEYFWRVSGINLCGDGEWSDVFSFTTRLEPVADFSATSFEFLVEEGDSDSASLVINNVGTGNLNFDIETDTPGGSLNSGRGFTGGFHPDNWELVNSPANTGGFVTVDDGPPVEVFVTGGDDGVGGDTDFQIEIPMDGTITFDWGYQSTDTGTFDTGGYAINGSYTQLAANNSQVPFFNETATVEVSAGDIFAFRVNTTDGLFGPGVFGATNFDFAPAVCGGDIVPVPWLTATPASGTVPEGDAETVTVSVDTTGLTPGDYEGWLCVSTNAENAPLVPMQVELTVDAVQPTEPVADITPLMFEFLVPEDGADSDTLFISNVGGGELSWVVDTAEPERTAYRYALDQVFDTGTAEVVVREAPDFELPQGFDRASGIEPEGQAPWRVAGAVQERAITDDFDEGFEDITLLPGAGWVLQNNSDPLGTTSWMQAGTPFTAHEGPADSFIAANFNNAAGSGTISNWLLTPEFEFNDGTEITFWTRTTEQFQDFNDRLQVRLSTAGASDDVGTGATDVGDFTELLLEINPDLEPNVYPEEWTQFTIMLDDSHEGLTGRVAFRYYVTDGGPSGNNSDFIGIDTFSVTQPEGDPPGGCEDPGTIGWLTAAPGSGTTSGGDTSEVTVMVDADGLAEGSYDALLCVSTNDPDAELVEIPVSMTVDNAPFMNPIADVTPESFSFTVETGGADGDDLSIGNIGLDTLDWDLFTPRSATRSDLLFESGPLINAPGQGPGGTDLSLLESVTLGMNTLGAGVQQSAGNRMADEFEVVGEWDIDSFTFYVYQSFVGPPSTITSVVLQIWDGPPNAGGTVIYGDTTTNVMESTEWVNAYRVSETGTAEDRPIMEVVADVSGLNLSAGTYWVDVSFAGTSTSGPWLPPIAILGEDTTGNAQQFLGDTSTWQAWLDTGTSTPQGMPFLIRGTGETACYDPTDVPWLGVSPTGGSVAPGDADLAALSVDADGLAVGSYDTTLCVYTNDPDAGVIEVPVSLEVTPPGTLGALEGTVSSLGFCGEDPFPAEGAAIEVVGQNTTFNTTADENGFYSLDIDESESPVDVFVTAPDHFGDEETGVVISGQTTTTLDFDLVAETACIDVDPDQLSTTLESGDTDVQSLDVSNLGTSTLNWSIDDGSMRSGDALIGFNFTTAAAGAPDPQNWTRISDGTGSLSNAPDDTGTATDVGIEWGGVTTDGFVYLGTATLGAGAVPQHDYDLSGMTGYGFRAGGDFFIELSGLQPNTDYEYWFVAYRATSAIDNVVNVSDGDDLEAFQFNQIISAGDNDGRFVINDLVGDDTQEWNDLSFVTRSSSAGTIEFRWQGDTQTTVIGALAIRSAVACEIPDWLDVVPTSGSIDAGDPADEVQVSFDSAGLAPGDYVTNLCFESNDPTQPVVPVPVTMTVTGDDPGELDVSPTELDFGSVAMGNDATLDFTVSNAADPGALSIELSTLAISGDAEFDLTGGDCTVGTELEPGESCTVEVTFTPTAEAGFSGSVEVATVEGESDTVTLIGSGFDPNVPEADITPASFSFTLNAGDVADDLLNIANVAASGANDLVWSIDTDELLSVGGRFDGDFDIDNWTFENDPAGVNGSFFTNPGPPVELFIIGGDDGVGGNADLFIEIPFDGTITFDWGYQSTDTGEFDSGGYVINGDYTVLAFNNTQVPFFDETATVEVSAGDIFAFRVETDDGLFGPGELGVTNFEFTADLCSPAAGASWLTATPDSGSTPAGDSDAVTVDVDTAGLAAGQYEGALCVSTNDPDAGLVVVPVSLEVIDPTLGTLEGTVESLGHCSDDPFALEGAEVTVLGDAGGIFETTTDASGFYSLMISENESPVEVLVEHPDHLPGAESGVIIEAGETTVVDFDLVLDASCATVDPESVETTVLEDGTATEQLEIGNLAGAGELSWSLETAEVPAGFRVLEPFAADPVRGGSSNAETLSSLLGGTLPSLSMTRPSNGLMVVDCDSEPGIVIQDDGTVENGYSGNPAAGITEVRFVDRFTPEDYPAHLTGVCVAFLTISGTTSFDIDIVVYDDSGAGGSPGTEIGSLSVTVDVDQLSPPVPPDYPPLWNAIDLSSLGVEVTSGSVYVGVSFAPEDPNYFIASDQSTDRPVGFAGGHWWTSNDQVWEPIQVAYPDYRALMVRPVLLTELEGCDAPEAISWLSVDPDTGTIAAGDSALVDVMFDADGLTEGVYEALLCLNSNDPVNPIIEIPVTMTVDSTQPAILDVDPTDLAFGEVDLGDAATLSFVVSNAADPGAESLELSTLDLSGDGEFAITGGDCAVGTVLEPGEDCGVDVTFTPSAVDTFSGSVAIATVDGQSDTVTLSGEGVQDPAILDVDPTDLVFGTVIVGEDATLGFVVSNVADPGAMSLELSTLALSGDGEFAITGGDCAAGTVLEPGESCAVDVTFTPSDGDSYAGSILVDTTNGQSATVTLTGEGELLPAELEVDTTLLDFDEVPVDRDETLVFTVSNAAPSGAASLTLSAIDLTGATEFSLTGGDCAVGTELAPSESCTVEVTFAPTAEASFSAFVSVATTDGDVRTVQLSGEGFELPDEIFSDRFED
jgi:serine protease AprX